MTATVVFSVPSRLLHQRKAARYPSVDKVPARDLMRRELLKHLGAGVKDVPVRAPGGGEVAERLRGRGVRYVWLLSLGEHAGTTRYRNHEKKLTPDLSPFAETEPKRPSLKKRDRGAPKLLQAAGVKALTAAREAF